MGPVRSLLRVPRKATRRLGRRGASLIWFATLDLIYGASLFDPRSWPKGPQAEAAFAVVRQVAPYRVWGVAWLTVGAICLIQAWMVRDRVAFAAAIALKIAWGACFAGSWILFHTYRGYLSPVIWFTLAAFIGILSGWAEPIPPLPPLRPPQVPEDQP